MWWIVFALLSALFAGITAILAKAGVKNADSDAVTALRTLVVLIFAWVMVFLTGSFSTLGSIDAKSLIFLLLSGLATGASWLCYFRALSLGDVNRVAPIDKSSTVLTILIFMLFFGEFSFPKLAATVLIAVGTYLMITKREAGEAKSGAWLVYALLSAVFASLTAVLGKVGIENVNSNVGTAIRTCVVLVMAWLVVILRGKLPRIREIDRKSLLFIALSGVATGASWLCYWRAMKDGQADVVTAVDKMSIIPTVAFSFIFLKEKLSLKSWCGLAVLVAGTALLLIG